jgi:hypothetical protein
VFRFDGRADNQSIPGDVCAEAPQGEGPPIFVEGAGSYLNCKHRFHLDERQTRDDGLRSRLVDDEFDVFRAGFLMVELCQSSWCRGRNWPISALPGMRSLRPRAIPELTRAPAEPPGG